MWRPKFGWTHEKNPKPYTGQGRYTHCRQICEKLVPEAYEWHDWSEQAMKAFCEETWTGITGCTTSSKSTSAGLYANLFFLCNPGDSGVICLSTTIDAAKRRIWREVSRFYEEILKKVGPNFFGLRQVNNPKPAIFSDDKDTSHMIGIVAVGQGHEEEGIRTLKGFHPKRILVICDELDSISKSVVDVCRINLRSGKKEFQFIGLGNPTSRFDAHGQFCEPKEGWAYATEDKKSWRTKQDALVLRFDGYDSPRIRDGNDAWQGILDKATLDETIKTYGENSKYVWMMIKGLWAPDGTEDVVIPENIFIKFRARDEVIWNVSPVRCACLDPAFGGDRCTWRRFDYGKDIEGFMRVKFLEPIVIPIRQNDPANPAEYQIAKEVKRLNNENDIAAENFILDCTGTGRGTASVLQREYSPNIVLCDFSGIASDRPVSGTNRKPCREEYDRKVSELAFGFAEYVKADMIRGLDDETCIEFSNRKFEIKGSGAGKRHSIETKADYKARGRRSPDFMDCACEATELLKRRHVLPYFVGSIQQKSQQRWGDLVKHFDIDSQGTYAEAF